MTKEEIIKPENLVYKKPTLMNDTPMHYCPGCSHGVVHKLIAEVIEEMGMEEKAVGISPVGCAVFIYNYLDIDWQEAAHGRDRKSTRLNSSHANISYAVFCLKKKKYILPTISNAHELVSARAQLLHSY